MDIKTMNKQKLYNTKIFCVFFLLCFALIVTTSCNKQDKNTAKETDNENNYVSSTKTKGEKKLAEVVDLAGRTVTVPTGDIKVILDESGMISAIAPLFGKDGNPFNHIVGWPTDIQQYYLDEYEAYLEKFPEIENIPIIGTFRTRNFSMEKIIDLKPDIFIMNLVSVTSAQEMNVIENLDKAGIQTVFVDFRKRPTQNTIPSMLLLGTLFQKQTQAQQFVNFYIMENQKVYSVLSSLKKEKKPLVFIEGTANAGWKRDKKGEYRTWGSSSFGRYVELAGGRNYGTEALNVSVSSVSLEALLTTDPDVIIGTGGNFSKINPKTGAVLLGYKAKKEDVQKRLQAIASRVGWQTLQAVKNKRLHSIHNWFYSSPYHFIAIQQIAKWLYPDKFTDLNPKETFKEFHDKFLPIDYSGMFWASLE